MHYAKCGTSEKRSSPCNRQYARKVAILFKDYQQRVLDIFNIYLQELATAKLRAEKIDKANQSQEDPDLRIAPIDWPKVAWQSLQGKGLIKDRKDGNTTIPFSPRVDELNNAVPAICYKIPTGGGKTLLAAASISALLGKLFLKNTGFILWIVPNEAIYTQTKNIIKNYMKVYQSQF